MEKKKPIKISLKIVIITVIVLILLISIIGIGIYINIIKGEENTQKMPENKEIENIETVRVLMTFKGLDNPIEVKEQKLFTPERNGFVAVEWGGTEIK